MMASSPLRPPLWDLAPINEYKEVLVHISFSIVHFTIKILQIAQTLVRRCKTRSGSTLFVNAPFLEFIAYNILH